MCQFVLRAVRVWVFNPFTFLQQSECALSLRQMEFLTGNFPHQLWCLKGILRPWRRVNPLSSPRWVCATEEMVVLVYAMICMYMESDPKTKESWHCH